MINLSTKKDEYVIKIMHDLQIPIVAQITALESFLSTSSKKIAQEEKELIELTLNSCNYMRKLTENFNSVYRLNYEALKLNYEKFNVVELIKKSIYKTEILLKYYELQLVFDTDDEIIIFADKFNLKYFCIIFCYEKFYFSIEIVKSMW